MAEAKDTPARYESVGGVLRPPSKRGQAPLSKDGAESA